MEWNSPPLLRRRSSFFIGILLLLTLLVSQQQCTVVAAASVAGNAAAFALYEQAAISGDVASQLHLAFLYSKGVRGATTANQVEALAWAHLACLSASKEAISLRDEIIRSVNYDPFLMYEAEQVYRDYFRKYFDTRPTLDQDVMGRRIRKPLLR